MKNIISLFLLPLLAFVATGCSDDGPQSIVAPDICGTLLRSMSMHEMAIFNRPTIKTMILRRLKIDVPTLATTLSQPKVSNFHTNNSLR